MRTGAYGSYTLIKGLFDALQTFMSQVTDPKAAVLASLGTYATNKIINLIAFYDGPEPPDGIFKMFTDIAQLRQRNHG